MDANLGEYEMKAFAIVEDKLPLSWNKGDQAVLPPIEFTRSSHKAAEWVKRWDLFIYIFLSFPRRDSSALGITDDFEDKSRR